MKVGRNDPCPCGSGQKYKKCCGASSQTADAHANMMESAAAIDALFGQAFGCHNINQLEKAAELYLRVLELDPGHANALHLLGVIHLQQGNAAEAARLIEKAVTLLPRVPEVQINLGAAFKQLGRLDEAEACYRKAIRLSPNNASALNNLGMLLYEKGASDEALPLFKQLLALQPGNTDVLMKMADACLDRCQFAPARKYFEKALAIIPDTKIQDDLLLSLHYDPALGPEQIYEAHKKWGEQFKNPETTADSFSNPRDPDRILRIGYVSPDLARHPVGYFMLPVLTSHDRQKVLSFCYSNRSIEDDLTARLRDAADFWRPVKELSDTELAQQIRSDEIDIVIDLAGHTANSRLTALAGRPAPLQAIWAGYMGTSGLPAMDYMLSDPYHSPEGSERFCTEKIIRLPGPYICYSPPDYAPEVAPLPAKIPGAVTFGCFNNLRKVNGEVIKLWGRLLRELPSSRLVLAYKQLEDRCIRDHFFRLFQAERVSDRVMFRGFVPHRELLGNYGEIDIALDPFPFTGGLTSLEGLWMGVPVITMGKGGRWASWQAESYLNAIGMSGLVASSADDYLAMAIRLAEDLPELAKIRATLRERMAASPLCDGPRFTRNLEAAYRDIWINWCNERN